MDKDLSKEIRTICEELAKDKSEGSYYYSWQANIAMSFVDEFNRQCENQPIHIISQMVHKIANNAAKNFLDLLIGSPEPPKQ